MRIETLVAIAGLAAVMVSAAWGQERLSRFDEDRSTAEFKEQEKVRREEATRGLTYDAPPRRHEDILPIVELLMSNEKAFANVELTAEQKAKIKPVFEEYERKVKGIQDKYEHVMDPEERNSLISRETRSLRRECIRVVTDELLDFQLDAFAAWLPEHVGIVKSLSDSPMGTALGLTEDQRSQIRKKADALGEKMKADFIKYRADANDIVFDALTQEQRERLLKIVDPAGTNPANELFKGIDIWRLAHQLDYIKDEFDLDKRRFIVHGVVYDRFGNKTGEDPEEVKKRLELKDIDE